MKVGLQCVHMFVSICNNKKSLSSSLCLKYFANIFIFKIKDDEDNSWKKLFYYMAENTRY